jgi:hypothetical protein
MSREVVDQLNEQFANLISSLKHLVQSVPPDLLYRRNSHAVSIAENILRSAAVIEQTCGGLTANLWDDPFEWTLPETLSNADLIVAYLTEVDAARQRAFNAIADDSALSKYISVPSGGSRMLFNLLLETLARASDHRKSVLQD